MEFNKEFFDSLIERKDEILVRKNISRLCGYIYVLTDGEFWISYASFERCRILEFNGYYRLEFVKPTTDKASVYTDITISDNGEIYSINKGVFYGGLK